ncbi:hypothetical protein AX16_002642 [Volvariella volvacea WC 439]|nr:hypothetical protein AX16_002642 [Volvariella volvacea WC 439]
MRDISNFSTSLREPRQMYQTFDFADYLQRLTGVNRWLIEDLKGGDANYTARIRRGYLCPPTVGLLGCWDGCGSVILKQAPPFLANVPNVSFSPRRQVVEAEALRLFSEANPQGLEPILRCNADIRVPKLILHDNQNCVIVQTDLGTHPDLYEVLITPSLDPILAASLGRTIGQFLAKMHNNFSGEDIGALVERFRHSDGDQVILSVIKKATELMQDAGVQDYQSLGNLAKHHWVTRKRNAFSQGDIWFGTLLVNLSNGDSTHPTIGICDWEFAGPNDHAADLAQLGTKILPPPTLLIPQSRHEDQKQRPLIRKIDV